MTLSLRTVAVYPALFLATASLVVLVFMPGVASAAVFPPFAPRDTCAAYPNYAQHTPDNFSYSKLPTEVHTYIDADWDIAIMGTPGTATTASPTVTVLLAPAITFASSTTAHAFSAGIGLPINNVRYVEAVYTTQKTWNLSFSNTINQSLYSESSSAAIQKCFIAHRGVGFDTWLSKYPTDTTNFAAIPTFINDKPEPVIPAPVGSTGDPTEISERDKKLIAVTIAMSLAAIIIYAFRWRPLS